MPARGPRNPHREASRPSASLMRYAAWLAGRTAVAALATFLVLLTSPADARAGAADKTVTAAELVMQALGNADVSYVAIRNSMFWSDNGQQRALIAKVYKDGERTRYEYPARGNRPARVVIETNDTIYSIRPGPTVTEVTTAHRERDPDVEGVRVKLAMSNYQWKFEPSSTRGQRIVSAWRAGMKYPAQRFWIATTPMVIVRSERYGPQNEMRSKWSFDSLRIVSDLPDDIFLPPHGPDLELKDATLPQHLKLEDVKARVGFEPVVVPADKIPEGYQLVDTSLEQVAAPSRHNAVRFVYSDGLDSFSLLETAKTGATEKIRGNQTRDVKILATAAQVFTSAEANLVHWQDKKRLYTLIGSLPPRTLVEISRAIIASTTPPLQPLTSTPTAAIQESRRRGFGEILARGWNRLLRMLSF